MNSASDPTAERPRSGIVPGDEYANPLGNCPTYEGSPDMPPEQEEFVAEALSALEDADVPVILAGAFASHAYTGIWRNTKDLDLFLRPRDVPPALEALAGTGFETELRDPWWLAKAWRDDWLVDLIFGMGNRELQVDDGWIERGLPVEIAEVPTRVIALEDLIVSKVFIAKRDRFDGADVAHLIRCAAGRIDWDLVLRGMGPEHRTLLLWHLVLFDYVYPGHADHLPHDLMRALFEERARSWENRRARPNAFRGSLLDERAFAIDVEDWGYEDVRKKAEDSEEVPVEETGGPRAVPAAESGEPGEVGME